MMFVGGIKEKKENELTAEQEEERERRKLADELAKLPLYRPFAAEVPSRFPMLSTYGPPLSAVLNTSMYVAKRDTNVKPKKIVSQLFLSSDEDRRTFQAAVSAVMTTSKIAQLTSKNLPRPPSSANLQHKKQSSSISTGGKTAKPSSSPSATPSSPSLTKASAPASPTLLSKSERRNLFSFRTEAEELQLQGEESSREPKESIVPATFTPVPPPTTQRLRDVPFASNTLDIASFNHPQAPRRRAWIEPNPDNLGWASLLKDHQMIYMTNSNSNNNNNANASGNNYSSLSANNTTTSSQLHFLQNKNPRIPSKTIANFSEPLMKKILHYCASDTLLEAVCYVNRHWHALIQSDYMLLVRMKAFEAPAELDDYVPAKTWPRKGIIGYLTTREFAESEAGGTEAAIARQLMRSQKTIYGSSSTGVAVAKQPLTTACIGGGGGGKQQDILSSQSSSGKNILLQASKNDDTSVKKQSALRAAIISPAHAPFHFATPSLPFAWVGIDFGCFKISVTSYCMRTTYRSRPSVWQLQATRDDYDDWSKCKWYILDSRNADTSPFLVQEPESLPPVAVLSSPLSSDLVHRALKRRFSMRSTRLGDFESAFSLANSSTAGNNVYSTLPSVREKNEESSNERGFVVTSSFRDNSGSRSTRTHMNHFKAFDSAQSATATTNNDEKFGSMVFNASTTTSSNASPLLMASSQSGGSARIIPVQHSSTERKRGDSFFSKSGDSGGASKSISGGRHRSESRSQVHFKASPLLVEDDTFMDNDEASVGGGSMRMKTSFHLNDNEMMSSSSHRNRRVSVLSADSLLSHDQQQEQEDPFSAFGSRSPFDNEEEEEEQDKIEEFVWGHFDVDPNFKLHGRGSVHQNQSQIKKQPHHQQHHSRTSSRRPSSTTSQQQQVPSTSIKQKQKQQHLSAEEEFYRARAEKNKKEVTTIKEGWKRLRIVQCGRNASWGLELHLCGFEVYGSLQRASQ